MLEQLLNVLIHAHHPLGLNQVYELLYHTEYQPIRHERRLHSLIGRLREVLGHTGILLRRSGMLSLSTAVRYFVIRPRKVNPSVSVRRDSLLKLINEAFEPVPISVLEQRYSTTRRTLQVDLAHLLATEKICVDGSTKNRRYYAAPQRTLSKKQERK